MFKKIVPVVILIVGGVLLQDHESSASWVTTTVDYRGSVFNQILHNRILSFRISLKFSISSSVAAIISTAMSNLSEKKPK